MSDNTKGARLSIQIRDALNTEWQALQDANVRNYTLTNQTQDVTETCDAYPGGAGPENTTEVHLFTGFSGLVVEIEGEDNRRAGTDLESGLTMCDSRRLYEIATSATREDQFKVVNLDTGGYFEGVFVITEFNKSGDSNGLMTYGVTLITAGHVTFNGTV